MIEIDQELAEQVVAVCRALYERRLVVAMDGNVSVRQGRHLLTTPSGVCKGFLRPQDLVLVDLNGEVLAGHNCPTSELPLHLEVYRQRPEANAVVHAHPPVATACTLAGVSLAEPFLPEVIITLGAIHTAPYAVPGTPDMADAVRDLVPYFNAILLERHGALTIGRHLWDAYHKMEKVEHTAWTIWLARQVRRPRPLPRAEALALAAWGISMGYLQPPGDPI